MKMEISMENQFTFKHLFLFVLASHFDEFKRSREWKTREAASEREEKKPTNTKWKAWIDKWIFRTSNTSISGVIKIPSYMHSNLFRIIPKQNIKTSKRVMSQNGFKSRTKNISEIRWIATHESLFMTLNRKPPLNTVLLHPLSFIDSPNGPKRVPSASIYQSIQMNLASLEWIWFSHFDCESNILLNSTSKSTVRCTNEMPQWLCIAKAIFHFIQMNTNRSCALDPIHMQFF